MINSEVLKFDDTPIQTQLDETPHNSDERSLKEKPPIESIRRTTHRLHIKTINAAAKLVEKSNI